MNCLNSETMKSKQYYNGVAKYVGIIVVVIRHSPYSVFYMLVGCEPGRYFDSEREECVKCPRGNFHNEGNIPVCAQCPPGQTTARSGAQSNAECESMCFQCVKKQY